MIHRCEVVGQNWQIQRYVLFPEVVEIALKLRVFAGHGVSLFSLYPDEHYILNQPAVIRTTDGKQVNLLEYLTKCRVLGAQKSAVITLDCRYDIYDDHPIVP